MRIFNMAFSETELQEVNFKLKRFVGRFHLLGVFNRDIMVVYKIDAQSIEIGEQLPAWKDKTHVVSRIKVKYVRTKNIWTVFRLNKYKRSLIHTVVNTLDEALFMLEMSPQLLVGVDHFVRKR